MYTDTQLGSASASSLRTDARGCPVSTRSHEALEHVERAQRALVSYVGDALGALDAAIAADPQWAFPHLMKADALLTLGEHGYAQMAAGCLQQAAALASHANERERAHLEAAQLALAGQWARAADAWERILVEHPRDLLALLCGHVFDFYRGDARNLQRRVSRVLPQWSADVPLYSYVLGMHAFGLEENNHYDAALDQGLAALELEPRDGWAVHAIAHVHEMRGEFEAGADWLRTRRADWQPDNAFAYHNSWHLALFHLERLDADAALKLLDTHVMPGAATALQKVDATAMLWRLRLLGVDVGARWEAIAALWPVQAPEAGYYAFNDVHAAIAQIGAGRLQPARELLSLAQQRSAAASTLGMMAAEVGVPLLQALLAHAEGRHADCVEILLRLREICHRFGGSHAQRDLVELTLLDAAIEGGQRRLARHLLNERLLMKARSPLTEHWARRM